MYQYIGQTVVGEGKLISLEYYVLQTGMDFGLEIIRSGSGLYGLESATVYNVTPSLAEAVRIAECLLRNSVFPYNLQEIISDYRREQLACCV
jgi:hypothetical protein